MTDKLDIVHTIHIDEHIKDEASLVSFFQLLEQKAYAKGLLIYALSGKESFFAVTKARSTGGEPDLYRAKSLSDLSSFIEGYKR